MHQDGYTEYIKQSDAKIKFANWIFKEYDPDKETQVQKNFLNEWLKDKSRREYDRIDFVPDLEECGSRTYNLFKGFNAEKYKPEVKLTHDQILVKTERIRQHIKYLTSGCEDFLLKFMSHMIQYPHIKSDVAILFRDMGELLRNGGGTGKNLLFEFFGNRVIGEDYTYVIGDNKEMYGSFNSLFEGKILVIVEEASGENHTNNDVLKSKITSKKLNVNKKNVPQYQVQDFSNYIIFTNSRNPLPVKQGNRRIAVFDVDQSMRGNEEYFNNLVKDLQDDSVTWAFYQFLKTYPTYTSSIQFQNAIPNTSALIEVRMLNAPIYLKWIISLVRTGKLIDGGIQDLYDNFKNWVKQNKESKEDSIISLTQFGLSLKNSQDANKDYCIMEQGFKIRTSSNQQMYWNIEGVVDGLKNLHLINDDFVYVETE
jgi:hypothetical protein